MNLDEQIVIKISSLARGKIERIAVEERRSLSNLIRVWIEEKIDERDNKAESDNELNKAS